MSDLKEYVEAVKERAEQNAIPSPDVTSQMAPVQPPQPQQDEDDDSMITEVPDDDSIANLKEQILAQQAAVQAAENAVSPEGPATVTGVSAITLEEIRDRIQSEISAIGVPADAVDVEANSIFTIISRYRKRLLVEEGLDEVELNEAVEKRMTKEINAVQVKYGKKNNAVVINVPETSADKIEFTEEQQRKIEKASKIQLFKIEKKDLNTLRLKNLSKKETKIRSIQSMSSSYISKYSIPLPLTGEFATFRGALIMEMLGARALDGESLYTIAEKKATLAYKHYIDGVNNVLKDETGATVLSYDQFINSFRYHDLDLMVFAVACASSGPMTASDLECEACHKRFNHEFLLSSLLTLRNMPETVKKQYDGIIENHTQLQYMQTLKTEQDELVRYESPITGNVYDIGSPSIARALNIYSMANVDADAVEFYIANIGMFVHGMYVYDSETDEYIEIQTDEYDVLIDTLKMLPQSELTMLNEIANDIAYSPEFILKSKCPECGRELTTVIPVTDVVFFVNAETSVEVMKSSKNGLKR